jgi:hypothetical protein
VSDYISKSALLKHLWDWRFQECPVGVCDEETETYKTICECIEAVKEQPTLDEKEIIRKYGEQIIKKLEFESEWSEPTFDEDGFCNDDSWEMLWLDKAIEIVKEECGISE